MSITNPHPTSPEGGVKLGFRVSLTLVWNDRKKLDVERSFKEKFYVYLKVFVKII